MKHLLLALLLLCAPVQSASAPAVINVNASTNCSLEFNSSLAVPVELPAGRYSLIPVQGQYTAENAWGGAVSGCDASGANCAQGWSWDLQVRVGTNGETYDFNTHAAYATPMQALANAQSAILNLPETNRLYFWNTDFECSDNLGGFSFLIETAVPAKPGSWSSLKGRF